MNLGDTLDEWEFIVEAGKVRAFGHAVQDTHADDSDIAAPTFPVVASSEFVERMIVDMFDLNRSRTVHGEQIYDYVEPIRAGDRLRCRATLTGDARKTGRRGGAMRILTTQVDFISVQTGRLVCRETMISIEKAEAQA